MIVELDEITALTPIPEAEAKGRGLEPLTNPYEPSEYKMLARVLADMSRGNIEHALVIENHEKPTHVAVYRRPS